MVSLGARYCFERNISQSYFGVPTLTPTLTLALTLTLTLTLTPAPTLIDSYHFLAMLVFHLVELD